MSKNEQRPVMACVDKRAVMFGYLVGEPEVYDVPGVGRRMRVLLSQARMCVRWSEDVRGIVGLAATGPSAACRITQASPRVELVDVHALFDVTEGAAQAWESAPWG